MLAHDRQQRILETLRERGSARVSDLSEAIGVSDMTIRRDLDVLAERAEIERVHGGAALRHQAGSFEPGFEIKQYQHAAEKLAIAELAATLVQPDWSVGLTAGTTTFQLAQQLARHPTPLTAVTNSPGVAGVLYRSEERVTTVLTGGTRTPSDALVGPLATAALSTMHLDIVFLGVHGVDPGVGYTTPNLSESETNRAFLARASQVVVVADHTKWGTRGMAQIAPLAAADILISDAELPMAARRAIQDAGVEVMIAPH